jgi:putative hydrolase of the HAD superfamily
MDSTRFRAVIFDLFGTLVDEFVSSVGQMSAEVAAALELPLEAFTQHWRQITEMRTMGVFQTVEESIEYVCTLMNEQVTPKQLAEAVAIRLGYTARALAPLPGAVATALDLRTRGYKLGLLSNCSIEIPIVWPQTELASLFDATVFSSRARLKKPDPRIYHLICERLGVAPSDCLFVADGENYELKGAAAVGIHPMLIRMPSRVIRGEVLREAREWQGDVIAALPELLETVGRTDSKPEPGR